MNIDFMMNGRTLVTILQGEIDHHTCVEIRQKIDREYQKRRAQNLLIDFEKIKFMDSSGIGMLMGRYRNVAICGGKVALYNVSKETQKLLNMSGIYKLMKVYESKEEAIANLA